MTGVLFRVDAGPGVGLGHLQRCLALAAALRHHGAECAFITNQAAFITRRIEAFGFQHERILAPASWGAEDLIETRRAADRRGWAAVAVDSGSKGSEYLQSLRDAGLSVCALEDLAPFPFPCRMVVNGDAHAERLQYRSAWGDTRFLLGPEYAILRPEFWEVPPRPIRSRVQGILLTLGGADPYNLMPALLRLIGGLAFPLQVTAVIGPFFERVVEIRAAAAGLSVPVRLARDPDSVRPIMEEADLAISAAGQTLYELARVGCPAVSFKVGLDQTDQLDAIAQAGSVLSVGDARRGDVCARIREALPALLKDAALREAMATAGRRMVDGQGAHRVAKAVIGMERDQRMVVEVPRGKGALES